MHRLQSSVLCFVALVGLTTAACGYAGAQVREEFSRTVALNADGEFEISNVNGAIEITTWDRNEVQILATKSARSADALADVEILISGSGDHVEVETKLPKGWNKGGSVEYRITMPASADLDAETVNGSMNVAGVAGEMELNSVNGSVEASGAVKPVDAETVNGRVTVRYAAMPMGGEHEFNAVNGSLRVYLPANVAGRFHASSVNGSIEADFPLKIEKARFGPSRSLDGELGTGGNANFKFETVNGSINIRSSDTTAANNR